VTNEQIDELDDGELDEQDVHKK